MSWGLDNNLTQRISSHDAITIVQIKTLTAGMGNVLLALAVGTRPVAPHILIASTAVGFTCYGISIVLELYALRFLGAAREAVFFCDGTLFGRGCGDCLARRTVGRDRDFGRSSDGGRSGDLSGRTNGAAPAV